MFGKRRTLVVQAADADAEAPEAEGARNVGNGAVGGFKRRRFGNVSYITSQNQGSISRNKDVIGQNEEVIIQIYISTAGMSTTNYP